MAVGLLAAAAVKASPAQAHDVQPSWGQALPAAKRWLVLEDFGGEAVLDRNTGLVWEQSPGTGVVTWGGARHSCADRVVGNQKAWRLPSFAELASLVDPSVPIPLVSLPPGHPFANVQPGPYWSASTNAVNPANAWFVLFDGGTVTSAAKTETLLVWCVRGGMNADQY
jgi:hypothetical protein